MNSELRSITGFHSVPLFSPFGHASSQFEQAEQSRKQGKLVVMSFEPNRQVHQYMDGYGLGWVGLDGP
jgi:hypothetical protein